jgi:hypothetical protein
LFAYGYALYISTKNSSSITLGLRTYVTNKIKLQLSSTEGANRAMAKITAMAAAVAVIALVLLPVGGRGEERPTAAHPHGLPFESPLALSPAAYDFFHPSSARTRRAHPGVAPAPAVAPRGQQQQLRESAVRGTSSADVAKADQEEGTAVAPVETHRRHNHTVTGAFVGAAAAALVAIGVAYAVVRGRVVAARGGAAAGAPKSTA